MTWIRHGWPGPGAAPDVVHAGRQLFAWFPGPEAARRVGRLPLPARQCSLDRQLVSPQHQHVDVAVFADRPPDRELDGVTAGDPPPGGAAGEDLRNL